jgi:hypothetical protein
MDKPRCQRKLMAVLWAGFSWSGVAWELSRSRGFEVVVLIVFRVFLSSASSAGSTGRAPTCSACPPPTADLDAYLAARVRQARLEDVRALAGPLLATATGGRLRQGGHLWELVRRLARTEQIEAGRRERRVPSTPSRNWKPRKPCSVCAAPGQAAHPAACSRILALGVHGSYK